MKTPSILTTLTFLSFLSFLSFSTSSTLHAQLPSTPLQTLDGKTVKVADFQKPDKPMVISFWATWCRPCVKELDIYQEKLAEWQKETGVVFVAVSIDDTRSAPRVLPFVKGRNWEFPVLLDTNQELKRAMNVGNIPHTILLDSKGKVVWQHTAFAEGDELELIKRIRELEL